MKHVKVLTCTTFVAGTSKVVQAFEAQLVVLDEASQTTDADSLVALLPQKKAALLVFSGDIRQPGPVVTSRSAIGNKNAFGSVLECSTMERLLQRPEITRVRLVMNYRCHPDILAAPSALWYDGMLVSGDLGT